MWFDWLENDYYGLLWNVAFFRCVRNKAAFTWRCKWTSLWVKRVHIIFCDQNRLNMNFKTCFMAATSGNVIQWHVNDVCVKGVCLTKRGVCVCVGLRVYPSNPFHSFWGDWKTDLSSHTNEHVFLPWSSRFCSADDEALRKSLVDSGGDGCKHQSGERPVREPEHPHSDWSRRRLREWAFLEPADLIHLHQPHLQVRRSSDPHHCCPTHSHSFRMQTCLVSVSANTEPQVSESLLKVKKHPYTLYSDKLCCDWLIFSSGCCWVLHRCWSVNVGGVMC